MKKETSSPLSTNDKDKLFDDITLGFTDKISNWNYFVNWNKVFRNVSEVEKELNLMNYLIGKDDIETEIANLILEYPKIIKVFPYLIASRDKSFKVLYDTQSLLFKRYDFSILSPSKNEAQELAEFVVKSGLGAIIKDKKVKNLVDYVTGIEAGLDSNGRKNRTGSMMEGIVEPFIKDFCSKHNAQYVRRAGASKIKAKWGIEIEVDKSSRIIDFVVYKDSKLFFIEVNFYSGSGSKLKATATEYTEMYNRYQQQGVEFIWITDGLGWHSSLRPLREYFDRARYLVNLEMLKNGILETIIK